MGPPTPRRMECKASLNSIGFPEPALFTSLFWLLLIFETVVCIAQTGWEHCVPEDGFELLTLFPLLPNTGTEVRTAMPGSCAHFRYANLLFSQTFSCSVLSLPSLPQC